MENTFSSELIAQCIEYFKEKHNQEITEETAIEYLNSLADLYGSFSELVKH